MENLGTLIYFISMTDMVLFISGIVAILSGVILISSFIVDDWRLFRRAFLPFLVSCLLLIFVPSKQTCYEIIGITKVVELYKSSESLQQLPEKSIEALNRILDSVAPEEEKKE